MDTQLKAGDKAPDFTLPSPQGDISLSDLRGEWVVLYYYPKDFTPGCTAEACDFRDMSTKLNAKVIGVSADDLDSHAKFIEEHKLNFPLLTDKDNEVAKKYGSYGEKTFSGKVYEGTLRSTFIIDPEGNIAEAMYNVKATGHATRVAERLEKLQA